MLKNMSESLGDERADPGKGGPLKWGKSPIDGDSMVINRA
jgi:hypothetical protein